MANTENHQKSKGRIKWTTHTYHTPKKDSSEYKNVLRTGKRN